MTPSFLAPSIKRWVRSGPERLAMSAMVSAWAGDRQTRQARTMSSRGHASSAPAKRGRGTTRDSRSERRVVEGARDSTLLIRFGGSFDVRIFARLLGSKTFATITKRHRQRPLHRASRGPPPPLSRGRKALRRPRRQVADLRGVDIVHARGQRVLGEGFGKQLAHFW